MIAYPWIWAMPAVLVGLLVAVGIYLRRRAVRRRAISYATGVRLGRDCWAPDDWLDEPYHVADRGSAVEDAQEFLAWRAALADREVDS